MMVRNVVRHPAPSGSRRVALQGSTFVEENTEAEILDELREIR